MVLTKKQFTSIVGLNQNYIKISSFLIISEVRPWNRQTNRTFRRRKTIRKCPEFPGSTSDLVDSKLELLLGSSESKHGISEFPYMEILVKIFKFPSCESCVELWTTKSWDFVFLPNTYVKYLKYQPISYIYIVVYTCYCTLLQCTALVKLCRKDTI